jgi:hypothetical protein
VCVERERERKRELKENGNSEKIEGNKNNG